MDELMRELAGDIVKVKESLASIAAGNRQMVTIWHNTVRLSSGTLAELVATATEMVHTYGADAYYSVEFDAMNISTEGRETDDMVSRRKAKLEEMLIMYEYRLSEYQAVAARLNKGE